MHHFFGVHSQIQIYKNKKHPIILFAAIRRRFVKFHFQIFIARRFFPHGLFKEIQTELIHYKETPTDWQIQLDLFLSLAFSLF